jgi:HK97 family phage major capsid protein
MIAQITPAYYENATWIMSTASYADAAQRLGPSYFQNVFHRGRMVPGMLGRPIIITEHLGQFTTGTGQVPCVLVDLEQYTIQIRGSMYAQFIQEATGLIDTGSAAMLHYLRVDGCLSNPNAGAALRIT